MCFLGEGIEDVEKNIRGVGNNNYPKNEQDTGYNM